PCPRHGDLLDAAVLAADARHPGVKIGLVLKEVEVAPAHPLGVVGRAVRGAADRAGKAAAWGEVDLDIEPARLGVEVAAAYRPGRGQTQRLLQQRCVTHGWTSASGPVLVQPGAVLATVKDAARRASSRGGLRPSLTAAARGRPGGRQAGTKKRPLAAEPRNATK